MLDLRLNPGLLLIVARHRRTRIHHQQSGGAVDLHLGTLPRQQCVEVNPHQGRNIERAGEDHGVRRGAAAAQQQPFEMRFIQFEKLAGGQLVGKANGGLPQLARGRKAGFAIDMLQQLEADIAHIEHPLL